MTETGTSQLAALQATLCERTNEAVRENHSTQAFPPDRSHLCLHWTTVPTSPRKARKW